MEIKNKNPRFAEAAWIADISQFKLRRLIERDQITLDASTTKSFQRRFTLHDVLKIAFFHILTKYGMEIDQADEEVNELFKEATYVRGRGGVDVSKEQDPTKILRAFKGEVWAWHGTPTEEHGTQWLRFRFDKEKPQLGAGVFIDAEAVVRTVIAKWEKITTQEE